jgi:hypothetical protein
LKRTLTGIAAVTLALGTFAAPMTAVAATKTHYNTTKVAKEYATTLKDITEGKTESFTVTIKDSHNKAISNALVSFSSSNTSVVTVSKSQVVTNKSGQATVVLTGKKPGTAYVTVKVNGNTHTYKVTVVAGSVAITGAPTDGIAVGQKQTLGFTDNGKAVTSGVTWSVDGDGAIVDQNGHFVASAPGTYTVTASYGGKKATAKVIVYGQAAGIKLSAASANLIANGQSTETITATVVDANGNKVSNFNGTFDVIGAGNSVLDAVSGVTAIPLTNYGLIEGGTANGNKMTFTITNGVGTITLSTANPGTNKPAPGTSDTIIASNLVSTNGQGVASNVSYGSVTVNYVAQTASRLGLKIASDQPSNMSVNGANPSINLDLQLQDATGAKVSTASGYVTLTLTGPGSFSPTSTQKTETLWVANGENSSVTVYGQQGVPGTIQVTATADGYQSASVTIPAVITTSPAALKVTQTDGTETATGKAFTLYTVSLVDSNGNVVDDNSDVITITDDASVNGGTISYKAVTNGQPSGALSNYKLSHGVLQFAVETTTAGSKPVTLKFSDGNGFTASATYNYKIGAAHHVASISTSPAQYVKAGQSVTWSVKMKDVDGNTVKTAGIPVTFTLSSNNVNAAFPNGNVTGTYTVNTDSNGVATVTVTVPSTASAGTFALSASYGSTNGGQTAPSVTENVVSAQDYTTKLEYVNGGSGVTWSTASYAAGATINAPYSLKAENAVGGAVAVGDTYEIISSNPDVLSFNTGGDWTTDVNGDGSVLVGKPTTNPFTLPTFKTGLAGTVTITVKDLSNPDAPSITTTVTVNPGPAAADWIEFNGKQISSDNPLSVTKNTPVALTVVNVDAGGNPVVVTGTSPKTVALADTNGGEFRLSPNGASVGEVQIPVGQSSVSVYYVNPSTKTITGGFSAADAVVSSANSQVTFNAPTSITAGQNYTVTGKVLDQFGNGMANQTVTLTFDGKTATATTDANGNYSVTVTPTTAGSGLAVTAKVGNTTVGSATATVNAAAPATITAGAASLTSGSAGTAQPVTFVVKDAYGNVVANSNVTVTVTSTGGTAGQVSNAAAGTYGSSVTVATDATGTATVYFKPGADYASGGQYTDTLTATDGSATQATTTYAHN